MIKHLFFIRCGRLEDANSTSLKDKSKRKVQRMGLKLSQICPQLERAIHTYHPAAKESCHKVLKAGGLSLRLIEELSPNDDLLHALYTLPEEIQNVVIITKKKELQDLFRYILPKTLPFLEKKELFLPSAALVHVEVPVAWKAINKKTCHFKQLLLAQDLPEQFPFQTNKGIEYRDRPAYYYSQSAVIPYRISEGGLEVLLISSSSGRKWGVPKGIAEPGMPPWDSAAKEAFEEAGVKGNVLDQRLGAYLYAKWGSHCNVEVFPLQVIEELPDEQWEESHRGKQWLPVVQAAQRVSVPELAELIKQLPNNLSEGVMHG